MGFELDACALERWRAFLEHAAHGVELATPVNLNGGNGILQDEAVALPPQPVTVTDANALIAWQGLALALHHLLQAGGVACEFPCESHIQQIEAGAELNHRADDGGFFDVAVFALGLLDGPLKRAHGSVFPEVDATGEPVVGVLAGAELGLAGEDGIGHALVTAVETENGALVGEEVHVLWDEG